jgi:outer membrane protein assembly factor BamB
LENWGDLDDAPGWAAPFWNQASGRRKFDTSAGDHDLNSKASSDVQPPRRQPRTVKTGCGVYRFSPAQLKSDHAWQRQASANDRAEVWNCLGARSRRARADRLAKARWSGGRLGGVQWGVATNGKAVYAAVSDLAIVDLALGQPIVLDPNKGGGLHALAVATGDVLWSAPPAKACGERKNCSPAQSGAVTATPDFVLSGSVDGHIRAYAPADGRLLWDYDMVKPFETVNGVDAHGGSLDSAGPTISGGMIFVNSGYGLYGGEPGNVLVAFAPRP